VISYRPFRNTDPPGLVDVWNETCAGRGCYPLRNASLLDRWVLSKPYFDPNGLIVAVDSETNKTVGFSLCGFGPNPDQSALSYDVGVICTIQVAPSARRHKVGKELLTRSEEYLTNRGAKELRVGAMWPFNPYLFGLYGGSNSPGLLDSDTEARPFLEAHGYARRESILVFQRRLDTALAVSDGRFPILRKRYDIQLLRQAAVGSWWIECVWGVLEPVEFRAFDKLTGMPAARAVVWELEGFNWRWKYPSAGILDVQVRPDLRKQGVGKLLVFHILRFLQDQFFGIGELQVRASDPAAVGLCKSVGFEQVDVGWVYVKPPA
jgi:ribosomal protein S18 acetylase RimI-like enzyme